MKFKRRIIAVFLVLIVSLSLFPINSFAAEYNTATVENNLAHNNGSKYDVYGNDIVYNNMSKAEQAVYDRLYKVCDDMLNGKQNAVYNPYGASWAQYKTPPVSCAELAGQNVHEFLMSFEESNPQFFFLSSGYSYDSSVVSIDVYTRLGKSSDLQNAKEKMFAVVDSMVGEIEKEKTDYDKIKKAHDLLREHVHYVTDYWENGEVPEGYEFHGQSCYTAFAEGMSVCRGYSMAFALLMNKVGIPAIVMTSTSHAWNMVELEGKWYNIDVLWDDDYPNKYTWFLKSNEYFQNYNDDGRRFHVPEDKWTLYNGPIAKEDYVMKEEQSIVITASYINTSDQLVEKTYTTKSSDIDKTLGTVVNEQFPDKRADLKWQFKPTATSYKYDDVSNYTIRQIYSYGYTKLSILVEEAADEVIMYRLYNPNSGEHFYTYSDGEKMNLQNAGWVYEGDAWKAPEKSNSPVYRLYNPNNGDHHYTVNASEKDMLVGAGWNYEGVAFYSVDGNDGNCDVVYRVYNPNNFGAGSHHYTKELSEVNYLVSLGWVDEGLAWVSY